MRAIVAIQEDGGIGYKNDLPWPKISADFKWFKEFTLNKAILVGRKTFKSLPPFKDRYIFIWEHEGIGCAKVELCITCEYYNTIYHNNIERFSDSHLILCGGAKTYAEFLRFCEEIYITHVKGSYPADTYFPYSQEEITRLFPKQEFVCEFEGGHKVIRYYK